MGVGVTGFLSLRLKGATQKLLFDTNTRARKIITILEKRCDHSRKLRS